jgi:hypothetical protein
MPPKSNSRTVSSNLNTRLNKMRLLIFILTITLTSCNRTYKVDDFTAEELICYKPFTKTDSIVYISDKGEKDTIIFKAPEAASDSTRNFEPRYRKIVSCGKKALTIPRSS